jgi:peptidoglycan-associated lipoprotein
MTKAFMNQRRIAMALVLGATALLAACSNKPGGPDASGTASVSMAGGGGPPGSSHDFVVTDSTDLTPVSRQTLDRQAQWLSRYGRTTFVIEGHADERGTREYNIALGARRAAVVQEYLISQGVAPNRMRTISYGKERPVAVCNDISCWSQNRRAVTVINSAGM